MRNVMTALVALTIVGLGYAEAAPRHHRHRATAPSAFQSAPAGLPRGQIYPSRPAWAPAGACFTDEGYGRFRPCDSGGRG